MMYKWGTTYDVRDKMVANLFVIAIVDDRRFFEEHIRELDHKGEYYTTWVYPEFWCSLLAPKNGKYFDIVLDDSLFGGGTNWSDLLRYAFDIESIEAARKLIDRDGPGRTDVKWALKDLSRKAGYKTWFYHQARNFLCFGRHSVYKWEWKDYL